MTGFDKGEIARGQEQHGANKVRCPDDKISLKPVKSRDHRVESVDVEQDRSSELQRGAQPADVARPPAQQLWLVPWTCVVAKWFASVRRLKQLQVRRGGKRYGTREEERIDPH